MSTIEQHLFLARAAARTHPLIAAQAVRQALELNPAHTEARALAASINPYAWTGLAKMPNQTIHLDENGMPGAIVVLPTYRKLGVRAQDIIAHKDTLYIGYGETAQLTHLLSLDERGFQPLRQLPTGTQYLASNWEEQELIYVRDPMPPQSGIPLRFEKDNVMFAVPQERGIILGKITPNEEARLLGTCNGIFYADDTTVSAQDYNPTFTKRHWVDLETGAQHDTSPLDTLLDLPKNSRYLERNTAHHPGNAAALYTTTGNRVRRLAVEIPITLCDALRLENDRQAAKAKRRGIR